MKRLVADTGPILHLHEAGALHLFQFIGEVLLAPLVLAELRVHAPALWPGQLPRWANNQTLSPAAGQRATEWQHAGLLQGGEAQALALALETKPDWFLTDDAGARLMAESLGIETHGSIGIILWSAATRLIQPARRAVDESGLRLMMAEGGKAKLGHPPTPRLRRDRRFDNEVACRAVVQRRRVHEI